MNALQGFNCHDLDKAKIDCSVIDEGYTMEHRAF